MSIDQKGLYRVLDANFNRTKEGLRVCEDVSRFIFDNKTLTRQYKEIRHRLTATVSSLNIMKLVQSRGIERDVGKASVAAELKRADVTDIFYANSQRVKESMRVLEEFAKLVDAKISAQLKDMRYKVYAIEKKMLKEF